MAVGRIATGETTPSIPIRRADEIGVVVVLLLFCRLVDAGVWVVARLAKEVAAGAVEERTRVDGRDVTRLLPLPPMLTTLIGD